MLEIVQSETFQRWFARLKDHQARALIDARIRRVSLGNLGDVRPVRGAVSELRIDHGAGYRIYVTKRGNTVVVLLAGGTKRTQDADIKLALAIADQWRA